jgi:ABC-2 type transport system ATP-binding protein
LLIESREVLGIESGEMTAPVLTVRSVSKRFGKTVALRDFSLELTESSILAVVGPNGAGKTTLIRLLAGFIPLDSGKITLLGLNPWSNRQLMNVVGVVPDRIRFPPNLTVAAFVGWSCRLRHVPNSWGIQEIDFWGLSEFVSRKMHTLSAGLYQRLMLVQALVHRPKVLLADEPASNLDTIGRRSLLQLLHDRCSNAGLTVVISSHILEDLQALSTDFALIDHGCLVRQGRLDSLESRLEQARFRVMCSNPDKLLQELRQREPNLSASVEASRLLITATSQSRGLLAEIEQAAARSGVVIYGVDRESALLETLLSKTDCEVNTSARSE